MTTNTLVKRTHNAVLVVPNDFSKNAVRDISAALNGLLADYFALYIKTKNFHWHVSGPHFRDYHLLFDEQASELLAVTDGIAERIRKIGGIALHSIGQIANTQRILDNNADYVDPQDMLAELLEDHKKLIGSLREAHNVTDEYHDIASSSVIENWVDEAEQRAWFLFETTRNRV